MKQATVKLPSGSYLIQEVPEDTNGVRMGAECPTCLSTGVWHCAHADICGNNFPAVKAYKGTAFLCSLRVETPGNWQLLGADPTNLTEVEAGEIVTEYHFGSNRWINYLDAATWYHTPTASLDSLAGSLGISKPFVILKLKTDNNDK